MKGRIILLHLLIWVFYLTYRLSDFPSRLSLQNGLIFLGVPFLFYVAISYTHYFYVLPLWLRQKRVPAYFAGQSILLIAAVTIEVAVENVLFGRFLPGATEITFARISRILWNAAIFILFTSLIRITIDRFRLENEKLVAELNYLKAQINPHFLFNTLHNLHFLVHAQQKNAADVIIRLSNIMRYMIYDAGQETVSLQHEIAYMKDYIHLESIRLNNTVKIDFNVEGDIDTTRIAPLILFPLLENAFKHGVNDDDADSWIQVDLLADREQLSFRIQNSKGASTSTRERSGLGLTNLKKRLELTYAKRYSLDISETDRAFEVHFFLAIN